MSLILYQQVRMDLNINSPVQAKRSSGKMRLFIVFIDKANIHYGQKQIKKIRGDEHLL